MPRRCRKRKQDPASTPMSLLARSRHWPGRSSSSQHLCASRSAQGLPSPPAKSMTWVLGRGCFAISVEVPTARRALLQASRLRFQIAPYVDLCRRLTGSVQGRFADRSIAKGYRRGLISATAGTCGSAAQWRAGSQNPATAPSSESADATLMAAAKAELKASGESTDPLPENTATNAAMPNMPPRKRPMLKTPEALPISAAATELRIAFWLPMFPRKGIQWDIGSLRVREREVESSNIGIKAGHKRESPSHHQARAFPTWTY